MSAITTRLLRRLWLAALTLFIAIWLFPVSTRFTRASGFVLLVIVWIGLVALGWRKRFFRFSLLGLTALGTIFLALPARSHLDAASLRSAYISGLQRYNGVTCYWGGESPKGIDCSGLIRRGLIDSLFLQGIRTFDAGLVRQAVWVWWNDCTARDFGEGRSFTTRLFSTPSIYALDAAKLLPGDLAVAGDGAHIMAFIGGNLWIEADPGIGRVVAVSVPSKDNPWFQQPMDIVRWNILQE